jgi:signal transduction histidine kinase
MQTQNPENVPHERETAAAHRMIRVAEREMQRVLLDIHDGPVQNMYAALSQLDLLRRALAAPHESAIKEATERVERIRFLLERGLAEIRSFIGELRPPEFERSGLNALIEGLIIQHEMTTDTRVILEATPHDDNVAVAVKICVYRVLQEAFSNAYRHGGATQIFVRLDKLDNGPRAQLDLRVRDNGNGFDATAARPPGHFGLDGMRDRVEMMGGAFEVHSVVGEGTTVHVRLDAS